MEQKEEWVHCNSCGHGTHHALVLKHRNSKFEQDVEDEGRVIASVDGYKDWSMLECKGCSTICIKMEEYFSEWCDPWDKGLRTIYIPSRNIDVRNKPSWFEQFIAIENLKGHFIVSAYQQIYQLLELNHYLAAMLTCRALLETVAVNNIDSDKRSFEEKLNLLKDKEFITSKQIPFLNASIYDAGSAAMHRGYSPSAKAVCYVLDVIEKLLHTIYIEPLIGEELQKEIPKRTKN